MSCSGRGAFSIGFTDQEVEGQWEWISGEPVTYTNWQPGEPNNAEETKTTPRMDYRGWNDDDGTTYLWPAIVEINDHDVYRLTLNEGDVLHLATSTPGDGPGQFGNQFDPSIHLYNTSHTEVGFDDNSARDGRNAILTFAVPSGGAGNYYVDVRPTNVPTAGTQASNVWTLNSASTPPRPSTVQRRRYWKLAAGNTRSPSSPSRFPKWLEKVA